MLNSKKTIAMFLMLLASMSSCRKDIHVPNSKFDQLFGTWRWVSSSGGFAGTTQTAEDGKNKTLEFRKNGICVADDGQGRNKMEFSLSEGPTIFSTEPGALMTYKDKGLRKTSTLMVTQSVVFQGPDTLLLRDECYDCFGHLYVRQK